MNSETQNPALETWKQQTDTALHFIDALVEGAEKMRTIQLAAASDAHACLLRAERAIAAARSPEELWQSELNWASETAQKSLAYWKDLFEATSETQGKVFACLCRAQGSPEPAAA